MLGGKILNILLSIHLSSDTKTSNNTQYYFHTTQGFENLSTWTKQKREILFMCSAHESESSVRYPPPPVLWPCMCPLPSGLNHGGGQKEVKATSCPIPAEPNPWDNEAEMTPLPASLLRRSPSVRSMRAGSSKSIRKTQESWQDEWAANREVKWQMDF